MDQQKHWRVLELDRVLSRLCEETSMEDAAAAARAIQPSSDIYTVERLLSETDAAYILMAKFGAPSFGSAKNCTPALTRAKAGGLLSMKELLEIGELLRVLRSLKEWRADNSCEGTEILDRYFEMLFPNKYFEEKIFAAIRSEEEMYDNASPALYDLCRKIRQAENGIREKLDRMVRSSGYAKFLQEGIVTMRDGRFVVPVKAEHRASVPGLVHDTSASGATLFIEPAAVVEINNDLKILERRRQEEIERILYELSAEAGGFAQAVLDSYESVVSLNLIFAKAKLGYAMRAGRPSLNGEGRIFLKNARHPLLDPKTVVPITVGLGIDYDTLIITGPNTGGKTVSLKTIGLLTGMTMCGLLIPAEDGSEISVFSAVLADIGDEQSIEQSLSTFSSHMKTIVSILEVAGPDTLILLDELGAGTDPVEGAALAEAIIMQLRRCGARIAATTHYPELKSYALDTEGVQNGSCEFDVASLQPTYRLLIGVPGRSNAFAISTRLGLGEEIVERARSLISDENLRFEKVVSSLEQARQEAETERREAERIHAELESARRSNSKILEDLNRERSRVLEGAKAEAQRIIDTTRAESNRLLDELEALRKQARNASDKGEATRRARAAAKSGLGKLESGADPVEKKQSLPYRLPRPLKAGDLVRIVDIDKEGTVLKIFENKQMAEVQAGIFKSRVKFDNLRLLENQNRVTVGGRKVTGAPSRTESTAPSEVDLRGMAADEAILELDRYIDHAVVAGIPSIRIIHGKGTGVLRAAVQEHLRRHRNIKSFRLGVYGEGEAGVTVAEIK